MPRPARVLFTIPNFTTAGSVRAMANIIERLDRSLFQPTVAVLKPGGLLFDELAASGVEVLVTPFLVAPRPIASLPARIREAAAPLRGRFDLWHSFHYSDDYTEPLIARAAGARWVFTKKNMGWGSRAWSLRAHMASRIAVQNLTMMEEFFASPALRWKCRYIPRGIDVDRWADADPGDWRSRLGVAPDDVVITCVGHIQARKNQLRLVEALAAVPRAHLMLAGRGLEADYAEEIRARVTSLGLTDRVHFAGEVDDVPALLAASDLFALVSHAEGSPMAMLEGMASGRAGVCARIGGIQELIDDGTNGILVDPVDTDGIGRALALLSADATARARMGAEAQQTTRRLASLDIEVARHQSLYLELVSG